MAHGGIQPWCEDTPPTPICIHAPLFLVQPSKDWLSLDKLLPRRRLFRQELWCHGQRVVNERRHESTYRKTVVELVTAKVAEFLQETEVLDHSLLDWFRSTRSGHDPLKDIGWQLGKDRFLSRVGEDFLELIDNLGRSGVIRRSVDALARHFLMVEEHGLDEFASVGFSVEEWDGRVSWRGQGKRPVTVTVIAEELPR